MSLMEQRVPGAESADEVEWTLRGLAQMLRHAGAPVDVLARVVGAVPDAGGAGWAVAARSAPATRRAVFGPEALTRAEREVVELAMLGLTNRRIAERRYVSVKAVEFHLGNAFRKLGISRRAELLAAMS